MRNIGNATLNQVAVSDAQLGTVTLNTATLAPNATATGQRTRVIVESDLPGPFINGATASGTPAFGGGAAVTAGASASVALTSNPAIQLTLQASAASASVGEAVLYTYRVENTGNVTLKNLSLTDSRFGSIALGQSNLAPREVITRVEVITVAESDLPGPLNNSATATARSAYSPFATVSSSANASLALTSNPTLQVTRQTSVASATVGQRVYYTFTVTNRGDVTLSNLSASDTLLGSVVLGSNLLLPNQSTTGSKTYVVTEANLPGPLTDIFSVAGIASGGGGVVTAGTSGVVNLTYNAVLQVERTAAPDPVDVGVGVTYRFTVTNDGNVTLSNLSADNSLLGAVLLDKTALAPGQKAFAQVTRTVVEGDLPGPLADVLTVTATPPNGLPAVTGTVSGAVALRSNAVLELVQTANKSLADIGDTVIFTMRVRNLGNVTLNNVVVKYDFPNSTTLPAFSLAPGAAVIRTVTHVVGESDLPGPITNNADVTAEPPLGDALSAADSDSVALQSNAEIKLSLYASHAAAGIGDTVIYTYEVKNLGNQTLQSLALTDNRFGVLALNTTTLAPDAKTTKTFSYVIKESDLPGPLANAATVSGAPQFGGGATVTDSDSHAVTLTSMPALEVTRQSSRNSATVGGTIVYTFTVRNAGDVTLKNVKLADTRLGDVAVNRTELAPGASIVVAGSTTVLESDLPGPLVNEVTAQATPKFGNSAPLTAKKSGQVTLFGLPGINLTQQASTNIVNVGETVHYTFTVENIGNVTLVDVKIVDTRLGTVEIAGDAGLAPGARRTQTVAYVVQESDLPGPLNNVATVAGTPIYMAGMPGGAGQLTRSTGGTVSVSTSSVTLRHVIARGNTQPAMAFGLDGKTATLGHGESKQFTTLMPGVHTVTVALPDQWQLAAATCDGGVTIGESGPQAAGQAVATFTLDRSQNITCTFTTEQVAFDLYMPAVMR